MDALSFDQMHPEYEQNRQDAAGKSLESQPPFSVPEETASDHEEEMYESQDVNSRETIPVADLDDTGQLKVAVGEVDLKEGLANRNSSSNNSSVQDNVLFGGSGFSFYTPSSMSPIINYDRDFPSQKLIAVFGRQFDRPDAVAHNLQQLLSNRTDGGEAPSVKFVPFTMKRKALLSGNFNTEEVIKQNLICMCYNASETRILLTGRDGFYSSLLRHAESILGESSDVTLHTI